MRRIYALTNTYRCARFGAATPELARLDLEEALGGEVFAEKHTDGAANAENGLVDGRLDDV